MEELDPNTSDGGDVVETKKAKADPRGVVRGVVTLLLVVIGTLFALQNTESSEVEFLTFDFSVPLIVVMLGSAALGSMLWAGTRRIFRKS